LESNSSCVQPAPFVCQPTGRSSLFIVSHGLTFTFGLGQCPSRALSRRSLLAIVRNIPLSSPQGALRTDIASVDRGPAWDSRKRVLSVSTTTHGIITGSATLSGGKVHKNRSTCTSGGKTVHITAISDGNAE